VIPKPTAKSTIAINNLKGVPTAEAKVNIIPKKKNTPTIIAPSTIFRFIQDSFTPPLIQLCATHQYGHRVFREILDIGIHDEEGEATSPFPARAHVEKREVYSFY
jgi:hypothetical protein